ncbi:MAG: glycosyltransferase family 39 protein [Chitinophagaceae bacterium]|nr:glycosyltransferase family 39 protein [Chitinophagaceae bacterium]
MKIPVIISSPNNFVVAGLLIGCQMLAVICMQFNGLYGQDAHEYLRLTRALNLYFQSGVTIEHSYFPLFYPLIAWLFSKIMWNDIAALQLVSMIFLAAAFIYLKKLIQFLFTEQRLTTSYLFVFFFLSPYVFRFGLLDMSDMLCLFLVTASVYYAIRYWKTPLLKYAALFSLFAGFGLSTRYAVSILLLFPALLLLRKIWMAKDYKAVAVVILIFAGTFFPDWLIRGRILFLQTSEGNFFIDYASNAYAWSPLNFFRSSFENPDGAQQYDCWNLAASTFNIIHPAFLFAGIIFIFFLKRNDFAAIEIRMITVMIIAYGLFIAGLHYQNNRYLLQSFPFVLLIFYSAFLRLEARYFSTTKLKWVAFLTIAIIQLSLFWYSFQKIYSINCIEKEFAVSLKAYAGQTVYTCDIIGALTSYKVENKVIDIFFNRITKPDSNSLLLFNYNYFSKHFKDQNPMLNWSFLNENHQLKIISSYPDGWELYAIDTNRN